MSTSPTNSMKNPTDSEPSSKRRKVVEPNVILRDLSPEKFIDKIPLFYGPIVIVQVGEVEFKLPKELLCYNSGYFRAALNGSFKEGVEQRVTLTDFRPETFRLVIQWIFHGRILIASSSSTTPAVFIPAAGNSQNHLKPSEATSISKNSPQSSFGRIVSEYLEFLVFANYLDLLGHFGSVEKEMEVLLINHPLSLQANHIRHSMALPTNHKARKTIVHACVENYVRRLVDPQAIPFRFNAELKVLNGFAADLLKAVEVAFRSMKSDFSHSKGNCTFLNPLTQKPFTITIFDLFRRPTVNVALDSVSSSESDSDSDSDSDFA